MYLQDVAARLSPRQMGSFGSFFRTAGGRNVVAFGLVSLFTDISSEMVTSVIPLYLTATLGLSTVAFGLYEGAFAAVSAAFRLAGGALSDSSHRHKRYAIIGYGLSTVTRFGLFVSAITTRGLAIVFLLTDRVGKGIRVAPRDAMISLSVPPDRSGTAFGVHRALDTLGALCGPLVAFVILTLVPGSFDSVFFVSSAAGVIGLAILITRCRQPRTQSTLTVAATNATDSEPPSRHSRSVDLANQEGARSNQGWLTYLVQRNHRSFLLVVAALNMVTISDGFVYLFILRQTNMDIATFPLLTSASALSYLVLAIPIGSLADRVGRVRVFIGGYIVLAIAYLTLANISISLPVVIVSLGLIGTYYACTDGVLAAISAQMAPTHRKGTLIGATSAVVAVAKLLSATAFGWLWHSTGSGAAAMNIFAVLLVAGTATSIWLFKRVPTTVQTSRSEGP